VNEYEQYQTQRAMWISEHAPELARRMESMTYDQINHAWEVMRDDYRRAVWAIADVSLQGRIRAVRGENRRAA
jgi:hypothetical protein